MDIIPFPFQVETQPGNFQISAQTGIIFDPPNRWNAEYLRNLLSAATGFPLPVRTLEQPKQGTICLSLAPNLASLGPEGYRLTVSGGGVILEAPNTTGIFYGIQSLRQLLPAEIEERRPVSGVNWQIPCLIITDKPRFSWRGFMLDEGRHFQGKEVVLRTLDLMALQKLNIFHWHLTDDQGWRIEIKKYPRLTGFASQRPGTRAGFTAGRHNGIPHGGFYSQAEMREIVAYAAERHITVVPEVEMPGHSLAALAAYPELSCLGGPFEVATHFGIFTDIYCAGKETVFTFLENVLDEVLEIFPSRYIHIGGDEAPKRRWNACPDCQRRIKAEGLKDADALQMYFTNRIAAYLDSRSRHAIGWNEILQPGLVESALVQYWFGGNQQVIKAIRDHQRKTIMSPIRYTYLDYPYLITPLQRVYRYEPVPPGLDEMTAESILGVEAPLWTERVPTLLRLGYQAYPRLTAVAEVGWTAKGMRSLVDFKFRLKPFLARLDLLGMPHASLQEAEPALRRI